MIVGLVVWFVVATAGNLSLRLAWPAYAAAEPAMQFTPGMLAARLLLGALSTVAAGLVAARIATAPRRAALLLGVLLVLLSIPVHSDLWDKFPLWYHAVFLVTLLPLVLAGAALRGALPNKA